MSNPRFGRSKIALDKEKAFQMWYRGMCDRDIADALGVKREAVGEWRRRNNLKVNPEPRDRNQKPGKQRSKLSQDAWEARQAGMNYGMYKAQQYDAIPTARTAWQRKLGNKA